MTINVSKRDEHTVVVNGKALRFTQRVANQIVFEDTVVVLLTNSDFDQDDLERGRNIFAFDRNGEEIWRIEDSGIKSTSRNTPGLPLGFTGIRIDDEGNLSAYHQVGFDCKIDPDSGRILGAREARFI